MPEGQGLLPEVVKYLPRGKLRSRIGQDTLLLRFLLLIVQYELVSLHTQFSEQIQCVLYEIHGLKALTSTAGDRNIYNRRKAPMSLHSHQYGFKSDHDRLCCTDETPSYWRHWYVSAGRLVV